MPLAGILVQYSGWSSVFYVYGERADGASAPPTLQVEGLMESLCMCGGFKKKKSGQVSAAWSFTLCEADESQTDLSWRDWVLISFVFTRQ